MEDLIYIDTLGQQIQIKLSEALASVMRQEVDLQIGHFGTVPIAEVHMMVNTTRAETCVYIPVVGDVVGDIFLFLESSGATKLADMMIGNAPGTTEIIGEFEQSALKELGNICSGVIVTELANRLGLSMLLTIPNLATDMAGALIDQVLISYAESANQAFALSLPFNMSEHGITGSFLLLFDFPSFTAIQDKLQERASVAIQNEIPSEPVVLESEQVVENQPVAAPQNTETPAELPQPQQQPAPSPIPGSAPGQEAHGG